MGPDFEYIHLVARLTGSTVELFYKAEDGENACIYDRARDA